MCLASLGEVGMNLGTMEISLTNCKNILEEVLISDIFKESL